MKRQLMYYAPVILAGMMSFSAMAESGQDVTILYTNDVHTYINNYHKDENDNLIPDLSYGNVKALYDDLKAEGKNVLLVDAGDHSQGTAYGAMDEGKSVIDIMNATGYQLATLGNHEFDYGSFRAFGIMEQADFPYVSCNFYTTEDGELVLPPYEVLEAGDVKVAFVGISTPESITKSTPAYFMNEARDQFIYQFYAGDDGQELYDCVQKAIDAASQEADYVIGLGHLGVNPASVPYTSEDVIANTTGLDAFIDGHSHNVMEQKEIMDKEGKPVVLSQTGCYLANIGEMTISGDSITTKLISEYERQDEKVGGMVQDWVDSVEQQLGQQIAVSDIDLYITDPESEVRLIRRQETNLGDLAADAVYYHFNEAEDLNCDVAIMNGGGIRANMPAGDLSFTSAKTIHPFGNVICLMDVTGQNILDALEWGARFVGLTAEDGTPAECGGFLHTAGLTYTLDTTIECTVQTEDELWSGPPTGEYRIRDVMVYNKENAAYEPLELDRIYQIGGINYTLRNLGDGCRMFEDAKVEKDYVGEDYLILSQYFEAFAKNEEDGWPHVSTENNPLSGYENYLIDYDNPAGSGRITIIR